MAGGLSRHPFGELCYRIFPNRGPWIPLTGLPWSRSLKQLKSSNLGKFPGLLEDTPPFVAQHGYKLQRVQTSGTRPFSGAKDLERAAAHWNCHRLGTELNRRLCFQNSVFTLDACKPPIFLETQGSLLPVHQKEEVPCGSVQKPHLSIHLHGLQRFPQYHRPVCGLMLCLTQPEPRPPGSQPFGGTHIL